MPNDTYDSLYLHWAKSNKTVKKTYLYSTIALIIYEISTETKPTCGKDRKNLVPVPNLHSGYRWSKVFTRGADRLNMAGSY